MGQHRRPTECARRSAAGRRAMGHLLALLVVLPVRSAVGQCRTIDDPLQVLDLHLEMEPADWDVIRRDTTFDVERPALFRCGGEGALAVMVRRKRSDSLPSDEDPMKVSLKIDFDDQVDDGDWHGHRKISLESGVVRRSLPGALLREGVSWQVMARSGAIAGAAAWVRVHLNGAPLGVYTRVEEIDKSFLRRHLDEDEGFLYKFDPIDPDVGAHRRLTREGEADPFLEALCWEPFDPFCPPPPDPTAALMEHLDIRQLLVMAAVNTLLGNTDGLLEARQNYYFYNTENPRLYFPWDLDLTLLGDNLNRNPHSSEVDRLLFTAAPGVRPHFDRMLRRLCEETMADGNIDRLLDDVALAVGPAIEADPLNHLRGGFTAELERIRGWLKARAAFLRSVLPPAEPSPLVINEVLASNLDTNRDAAGEAADWVEVLNRGSGAVSLEGLFLSDDPARPFRWPLPPMVLEPGGRLLVWCDEDLGEGTDHAAFQLDRDGNPSASTRMRRASSGSSTSSGSDRRRRTDPSAGCRTALRSSSPFLARARGPPTRRSAARPSSFAGTASTTARWTSGMPCASSAGCSSGGRRRAVWRPRTSMAMERRPSPTPSISSRTSSSAGLRPRSRSPHAGPERSRRTGNWDARRRPKAAGSATDRRCLGAPVRRLLEGQRAGGRGCAAAHDPPGKHRGHGGVQESLDAGDAIGLVQPRAARLTFPELESRKLHDSTWSFRSRKSLWRPGPRWRKPFGCPVAGCGVGLSSPAPVMKNAVSPKRGARRQKDFRPRIDPRGSNRGRDPGEPVTSGGAGPAVDSGDPSSPELLS